MMSISISQSLRITIYIYIYLLKISGETSVMATWKYLHGSLNNGILESRGIRLRTNSKVKFARSFIDDIYGTHFDN